MVGWPTRRDGHLLDLRWLGVGGIGATVEYLVAGLPTDPPCTRAPWLALCPSHLDVTLPAWVQRIPLRSAPGLRAELDPRQTRWSSSLFVHQLRPLWAHAQAQYVHDLIQLDAPSRVGRRARATFLRRIVASSNLLLTPSQASKDRLAAWVPSRADAIEVVHPPVIDYLTRRHGDARNRLAGRRDLLLCVGRDKPHKNIDRLLAAYDGSAWQAEGVPLHVVLGGDARAVVARRAVPSGAQILGHLPDASLAALYRRAALVVCPSTDEGFGLPVVEGAWWGAAVSCSDIPVLREAATVPAALRFDPEDPHDIRRSLDVAFASFADGCLDELRPEVVTLPSVGEYTGEVLDILCRGHG